MAASKLLNLRNPAIQFLIRRQLLHPCATASHLLQPASSCPTLPDTQSLNLIHPENGSTNHSLNARSLGIHASNFHLYLPSGPCFAPASRTYATGYPKDDAYEDDDEDDEEDDDEDIQDYSGSDFDDGDDADYEDDSDSGDEDSDARPRSGGCRN